ncbi:MAG: hypothetical protein Q9M31_10050, partial [Mariprofundus sp.]|nr:hypothetical protein [Mariprofundus sp.]
EDIIKAIGAVDRMFDEDERKIYEVRMQAMAEVASKIASAKAHGRKEGLEKGREEGIELSESNMVMKASQAGMDHATIAKLFDLPLERVQQLLSDCA